MIFGLFNLFVIMFWSLFVNFTLFAGLFRINTTYSNVFLMKS